ncbi:MAG TPA: tetratricopeptide repeat protein [Gemmatimonadaceae bacterium]
MRELMDGERAELSGDYPTAAAAYRSLTSSSDAPTAAEAYFRLGRVNWRQSRFDAALTHFEAARALAVRLGAHELEARVANGIGAVHYARGDYPAARRAYADAQSRTRDGAMRGRIILNLGVIANIEGDLLEALSMYEEARELFQEHHDRASATLALHNRGMVEADLQRWDDADQSFLAALSLATEEGNVEMVARTLVNRSEVLTARGLARDAVEHCDRALASYATLGDEVGRGEALRWRAHALRKLGERSAAERSAAEAMQVAARCGARLLEAEAARELGYLCDLVRDPDGARRMFTRALGLFRELGSTREVEELERLVR